MPAEQLTGCDGFTCATGVCITQEQNCDQQNCDLRDQHFNCPVVAQPCEQHGAMCGQWVEGAKAEKVHLRCIGMLCDSDRGICSGGIVIEITAVGDRMVMLRADNKTLCVPRTPRVQR